MSWGSRSSAVTTKMYNKTLELYDIKLNRFAKPYIREAWFKSGLIDDIQLCTKNGEKVNTMTASWGGTGILWNKPVAFIFIRPQRYTYELIENDDTWGMVKPDRTKYDSFYSVSEVYTNFQYLDKYYLGNLLRSSDVPSVSGALLSPDITLASSPTAIGSALACKVKSLLTGLGAG